MTVRQFFDELAQRLEYIAAMAFAAIIGRYATDLLKWLGMGEEAAMGLGIVVMGLLYFGLLGYFMYAYFLRDNSHLDHRNSGSGKKKND